MSFFLSLSLNPGRTVIFKKFSHLSLEKPKISKLMHIYSQSVVQKKKQIQTTLNALGDKTIYGLSKTWLKGTDDQILWEMNRNHFKTFMFDRKFGNKTKGGSDMLITPKTLNPKSRNDLNCIKRI